MDSVFLEEDHQFIRQEARRIDASNLESQRRKALVDFRIEVARMRKDKEDAKDRKNKADSERLAKVVLISKVEDIYDLAWKFTIAKLGDQLDAFRYLGLPDVPAKGRFRKKAEWEAALKEVFLRYKAHILEHGPLFPSSLSVPASQIADDWEKEEEDEMEE